MIALRADFRGCMIPQNIMNRTQSLLLILAANLFMKICQTNRGKAIASEVDIKSKV